MAEPEDPEEAAARSEAEAAKKVGSEAYKRRDFAIAVEQFSKAWELWPKDITFLTNLAGELVAFWFGIVTSPLS